MESKNACYGNEKILIAQNPLLALRTVHCYTFSVLLYGPLVRKLWRDLNPSSYGYSDITIKNLLIGQNHTQILNWIGKELEIRFAIKKREISLLYKAKLLNEEKLDNAESFSCIIYETGWVSLELF